MKMVRHVTREYISRNVVTNSTNNPKHWNSSGRSGIPCWEGTNPIGGANIRRGYFSAKTKELGPVGRGARPGPLDPPLRRLSTTSNGSISRTFVTIVLFLCLCRKQDWLGYEWPKTHREQHSSRARNVMKSACANVKWAWTLTSKTKMCLNYSIITFSTA